MAQGVAIELVGVADGTNPALKKDGRISVSALRRSRASFNLADAVNHKLTVGDTDKLCAIPEGAAFAFAVVTASVPLPGVALSIGDVANPAKYATGVAVPTANVPTMAGNAAAIAATPGNMPDDVIMTVAGAALPNAGNLVIDLFFSMR